MKYLDGSTSLIIVQSSMFWRGSPYFFTEPVKIGDERMCLYYNYHWFDLTNGT